MLAIIIIRVSL